MPSRFDSATPLEQAAAANERQRLNHFATKNRLQRALHSQVLPIFGIPNIEEATLQQLRVIHELLQKASMYSPALDPDGVEPMPNPVFVE